MSDALAAGVTALLLPLVCKSSPNKACWAGFLAGSLVAVRLPMILNLPALFVALPRSLWSRALLAMAIPLVAYGAFNHFVYGGPFTTGYHRYVFIKNFRLRYIVAPHMKEGPWLTPDALDGGIVRRIDGRSTFGWPQGGPQNGLPSCLFYPAVLSGAFWVFSPPFLGVFGLASFWWRRHRPEARFALVLSVISLVFFCFYFYQALRFMAAPASILLAGASAQIARWLVGEKSLVSRGESQRHHSISCSGPIRERAKISA